MEKSGGMKNGIGWLVGFLLLFGNQMLGHEIRPGYLEINQTTDSTYKVLWKVPVLGNRAPKITPILPFEITETDDERLPDAYIRHYEGVYLNSLANTTIEIEGLATTLVDVLVQLNLKDDIRHSFLLQPDNPKTTIPIQPDRWQVAKLYTILGIEHILIGIDHLLFILGLLLLVKGIPALIKTITAFTVAHSITLALAALDLVKLPQAPVEAVIALSIVFLAREYLMVQRGERSLTAQYPWIVAFTFGLLHGFGFAGVLQEIGFPQKDLPIALFTFNVGVEIGQLIFVAGILLIGWIIKKLNFSMPKIAPKLAAYLLGTVAMFWVIERTLGFVN